MGFAETKGRCCRLGQEKETRLYVIQVEGDEHDRVANIMRIDRKSAAAAMSSIDPHRLERENKKRRTKT